MMNRSRQAIFVRWIDRIRAMAGQRGVGPARKRMEAARKRFDFYCEPIRPFMAPEPSRKARKAVGLAALAALRFDEHGSQRGDHRHTAGLDYVPPAQAVGAPYHDSGRGGLGLVAVTRTRYYARSYGHGPSSATSVFLVGRNEAGSFFAHPVPGHITTVAGACQWIWQGRAESIIRRQGDIALVAGNGGPRIPKTGLPRGHRINETIIVHETHDSIPMPGPHERIIVARRAHTRSASATRD